MSRISFNIPPCYGTEEDYLHEVIRSGKICGDGPMTARCRKWIEHNTGTACALLTTSGTSALEMAAMLCNIRPGDEVIMPSYTLRPMHSFSGGRPLFSWTSVRIP